MLRLHRAAGKPRPEVGNVLFWVPGGMPGMLHVETVIANALRLRGADVLAVICDGALSGCVKREITDGVPVSEWARACASCHAASKAVVDEMGISSIGIGELISPARREEIRSETRSAKWADLDALRHAGVDVGNNARSAIFRYLQGAPIDGHEEIVPEYAYSAAVVAEAADTAIGRLRPSRIFTSHGIYVDWGPALQVAFKRSVRVAAWMASYLRDRFYLRHVEDPRRIDLHNMSTAAWSDVAASPLTDDAESHLAAFFEERYGANTSFDMKTFSAYDGNTAELRARYSPDPSKPLWGVMAHINWDCVSDYAPMLHPSFDDWMIDTVRAISANTEVAWLVKVHPAEAWENQATGVGQLIAKAFPDLPPHVRIIAATEPVSPLDFQQMIDGAVTVYGTAGLETALQGKPVILAGEAHYGGKGFTHDPIDRAAYLHLLRSAASIARLTDAQIGLARRYAYCYFIQRQIPLPLVKTTDGVWWKFQYDQRRKLEPGRDPFVDFIAERLLEDRDFIMPRPLVALASRTGSDDASQELLSQVS